MVIGNPPSLCYQERVKKFFSPNISGVGRLIRSKKDKGICAILDNRVLTKPYGRHFLNALPPCPMEVL